MIRSRNAVALLLFFALCALGGAASAQYRPPPPVPPRADLVSATQRLAQQAAVEAPHSRFARVAQRLAMTAAGSGTPHERTELDRVYVRARRMLVTDRQLAPSEALLDAWDDVVAGYAPLRRVAPAPVPPRPPAPGPIYGAYTFEGRFEQAPVQLAGRTLEELEQQCLRFVSAIDARYVDDVTIGTRSVRNGPSYWDAQALCSIVVLNATTERSYAPVHTSGSIEGVPFSVHGTRDVVARIIEQHVPRLTRTMHVDDVEILGRQYRNGPSYWTPQQIASLIVAQLPPGAYGSRYGAQGRIEEVAFSFQGGDAAQIESQCRAFVGAAVTGWIDDIEIDGRQLRAEYGYWNPEQACQIIATQSRAL